MRLTFNLTATEAIALTERFQKNSPSHQRIRNRTRWALAILLLPIVILFTLQFGFSFSTMAFFVIAIVAWFIIAPSRFDARIRRYAQNLMEESANAKSFGQYTIQIDEDCLVSDVPTGHSEYKWSAVDHAILTENYLFIFLCGASGFPIKISDVGYEDARMAQSRIVQLIELTK